MSARLIALTLLLTACQSPAPPASPAPVVSADKPSPPVTATPADRPDPSPAPPPPPRTALYLEGNNLADLRVHRLGAGAPIKLPFTVSATHEGEVHVGSGLPVLSPDGSLLAFGRKGRLYLARTDGSAPPEAITRFTKGEVRLLLGGFSPDGKLLLFHQGKRIGEQTDPPLPPGFVEGFHLLHLEGRKVEPIPSLDGFDIWDGDSRHVIFGRERSGSRAALVRADTRGDPPVTLQETDNPWGFGQVASCGSEITFTLEGQMMRGKPDGSGRHPIGPQGTHGEYQWPRCSPGGAHVLYHHREGRRPNEPQTVEIAVAGASAPLVALRCPGNCLDSAWESDDSVLVIDRGALHRIGLDGKKTVIAGRVTSIVVP